ncbi:MAG: putative amidohydrolase [Bradymonadia bacterium]|jgi:predicted amidohydrolase
MAAIQYRPPKANVPAAREGLEEIVGAAARGGARLIVAPEMSTTGYIWPDAETIRPHTETADGPTAAMLGKIAAKHDAWIVAGFAEDAGEHLYNSCWVIGPSGELEGVYRKVLLFDADLTWASAGTEHQRYTTDFGTLVPGICMDINDDRFVQHVRDSETDIVAFCTNWIDEGSDVIPYWRWRLARWRGWFVAANTWGMDGETPFLGRSCVLPPESPPARVALRCGDTIVYGETGSGSLYA